MYLRTYKSKKDTGGGLDPREMVTQVNEKESAFNAFYIDNIKQTKREQSCMSASNNYGTVSKRIRKKKYIKRLVKKAEPTPRESLSSFVFLTPDKSLRVNKALDLFDQLLNSSPAWSEAKQLQNKPLAVTPKQSKTYTRKKKPAVKKFNYSSSSSASDKENRTNNKNSSVENATDIIAHELVVERDTVPPNIDESLNKMVMKLSLMNKAKNNSSGSLKKDLNFNKNRLTTNLQSPSPLLKTSPLSSTPFTEKMRNKSIYKFSPIPMGQLEESPNYVTITEDDNEGDKSIVINCHSLKRSQNKGNGSVNTHLSKHDIKSLEKSKSLFSSQADSRDDSIKKSHSKEFIKRPENKNVNVIEISSIHTSEMEPFMGFDIDNVEKIDNYLTFEEDKEHSIIISTSKISKHSNKSKDNNKTINKNETQQLDTVNHVLKNMTQDVAEYTNCKGETKIEESIVITNDFKVPSQSFLVSAGEAAEIPDSENEQNSISEESGLSSKHTSIEERDDSSSNQSIYNTCDFDDSISEESIPIEPVVAIERLNMDIFFNYYRKMPKYSSEDEDQCSGDDEKMLIEDNTSFESCEKATDQYDLSCNADSNSSSAQNDSDCSMERSSLRKGKVMIDRENVQEEKCISFVTTRRRNEFTNNSTILVLDDSEESSNENDKTVLSNKINVSCKEFVNSRTVDLDCEENITLKETNSEATTSKNTASSTSTEPIISYVSTRNSTLSREKSISNVMDHSTFENKPGIILQPGKKWERSLSIYRRMTMANDHFDHSILEDEDLQNKGRKYRLSVIHTMEMQENSSINNESIHSRRSTFVPKPSRSTIRIVKETNNTRLSISNTTVFEDLKDFIEDCDDTIVELSKLSIAGERDVTVVDKFNEDCRIATARDYVLRRCNQTDTIPFDECYPDPLLKNCRKIGEGVYGEVYLWRAPDGRARVMKVVPIAGDTRVNGEQQKDFHEIISEIVIAMELSALRAPITEIENHFKEGKDIDAIDLHTVENATDIFNEVLAVRCVYGAYPSRLLDLWELFDECRGSENDNPAVLPPDQQFIVLELANAGQDLESYRFTTAEQAYALFLQVAFGLAVGEEAFQFEHRDLHWGNVLIAPTDQKYATFVLRGRLHRVPRAGVAATIIDYSLSRVSLPLGRDAASAALYNDLASDEGLFSAVGDYQFAVYRLMREKLGNDWKNFEPYTNILWLHYLLDKMVLALRYEKPTSRAHKAHICKLKAARERILSYGSAAQFVLTDNEY